uniref:Hypothetical_protein n=1 Tax=Oryza glaberrima TaxID=4538 RepID=G2XLC4_ORYGL|nr:hypothetical_protein [Oryza glaberrima]
MAVGGNSPAVGGEAAAAPLKPRGRKLAVGWCRRWGQSGKVDRRRSVVAPRLRRRGRRQCRHQLEERRGKGGEGEGEGEGRGLAGWPRRRH